MVLQQILAWNRFITTFGLFRKFFLKYLFKFYAYLTDTIFFYFRDINIYAATVPDRMHHLDLGLFHYQIKYTKDLLKSGGLVDKMDQRIAMIPRHPGLKIFSGGLQSIARLTASEYRDLMKVMVFVVDNLVNKELSEVYVKWNNMYLMSRFESFKESDLENFQVIY